VKQSSSLLISEKPLVVLPSLATAIGLNEAIVVQQVHYWITHYREVNDRAHYRNGRWWVWNSYSEWKTNFPFWSEATIKRVCLNLEKMGVLMTAHLSENVWDRTKWYTIDYDALDARRQDEDASDASGQVDPMRTAQNEPMRTGQVAPLSSETTTETTTEIKSAVDANASPPPLPSPKTRRAKATSTQEENNTAPAKPRASRARKVAPEDLPTFNRMKVLVCHACTGQDNDPVFWEAHGAMAIKVIKKWLAVGYTPEQFEADYIDRAGRWFLTWMAGPSGKRPLPKEILATIGLLDNYRRGGGGHAGPGAVTTAPPPAYSSEGQPAADFGRLREAMLKGLQEARRVQR
jgi:hypothetical protein